MKENLDCLNLIDLISEKHKELRKKVLEKYYEKEVVKLSEKGYYLISILNSKNLTISESARNMNISRQAVHKLSKELLKMGFIETKHFENNKRDMYLILTEKGKILYEETNLIKIELENEIIDFIGKENVEFFKNVLKYEWIKK